MCGQDQGTGAPDQRLSDLIKRETGVEIDKYTLALFIRCHWGKVSALAHKIHGSDVEGCK